MTRRRTNGFVLLLTIVLSCGFVRAETPADPLPSWNDGPIKQSIIRFVRTVTDKSNPQYVAPAERIAVFDNDGTLWCEQAFTPQQRYALDRIRAFAPQHPEWKDKQPFKAIIENDPSCEKSVVLKQTLGIITDLHAGMTTEEYDQVVMDWITKTKHPRFHRPYTEMVYQPMLEVLAYLRANDFKTWIVTGGTQEFMRPWCERVYGVVPEQVIGSWTKATLETRDGKPVVVRLAEVGGLCNHEEKVTSIYQRIGRRPIAAFGNSDGDLDMLRWTTAGEGARFGLIVHHTDAEREYAYDRVTKFGKLDKGLQEAKDRGWALVDMKKEWNRVFTTPGK